MLKLVLYIFAYAALLSCSECLKLNRIDKTYYKGVKAYEDERWSECIAQFEESLYLFKLYRFVIINCRLKCNTKTYKPDIGDGIGQLKIYELFFNIRQCLTNCQDKSLEDVQLTNNIGEKVYYNMQARKPYEYLHMCYFHMNALPKAASASYTYLVANPNDETAKDNLKYYIHQPEVDANEIVDLLGENYKALFNNGMKAYNQKNWLDTVEKMEEVLIDFFSSENSCRAECERQPEQEWSSEFIKTISNNMVSLLHCQQHCQDRLKILGYKSGLEFIADVLNYLQISYYHLEKYEEAAKSVTSYLLISPLDQDMLENKKLYSEIVDSKAFIERSDVTYYFKRDGYEKQLLNFFHQEDKDNIDTNTI